MNIKGMTHKEIVDLFLKERGVDPGDETVRAKYSRELIERFKRGDTEALTEILRIGPSRGGVVQNRFSDSPSMPSFQIV